MSRLYAEAADRKRRRILKIMFAGSLTAVVSPILYVIGRFVSYSGQSRKNAVATLSGAELTHSNPSRLIELAGEPVIVVRTQDDTVRAFTATCTHLGCTVSYRPSTPGFYCKCHAGRFDANGVNVPGTRPKEPLTELAVTIEGTEIAVRFPSKARS